MKIQLVTTFILGFCCYQNLSAQSGIEGIWRGESICQIKNSSCHDEVVVYHISKDSSRNSYTIVGNKIVNGKEDYMGTIKFSYDPVKSTLISIDEARNVRWEFHIQGNQMSGKLISRNELFRLIRLKKDN
jgi:hypothetical protein